MIATAHPIPSSAAAPAHAPACRPLELLEARQRRDSLKALLREEQAAMAEFLVALADFDLRRGWEPIGHASLFAFLHVELKLPNPSAYWRMSAARVLQRFPDLVEPLRDGRLCCSATAELAKVLTEENRAVVLPRFYGLSAREAQEMVAELQPRQAPATRTVVTEALPAVVDRPLAAALAPLGPASVRTHELALSVHPNVAPPKQLRTSEVAFGGEARCVAQRAEVEPLTAELRRLHITVSRQLLKKLDAARDGLSHAIPGATTEQVIEAALDLLLDKQARARGHVKRPRTTLAATAPRVEAPSVASNPQQGIPTQPPQELAPALAIVPAEPPPPRRTGPRETIPAAVRRAVWERDGGRCSWPLDGGGCCGSTHLLELDHIHPWARSGEPTVANLRVVCRSHNALAARREYGARCAERYRAGRRT